MFEKGDSVESVNLDHFYALVGWLYSFYIYGCDYSIDWQQKDDNTKPTLDHFRYLKHDFYLEKEDDFVHQFL